MIPLGVLRLPDPVLFVKIRFSNLLRGHSSEKDFQACLFTVRVRQGPKLLHDRARSPNYRQWSITPQKY